MSHHDIIKGVLVALAILNLAVSIAVVSNSAYIGRRKIMQILIIWIIPVISGVFLGLFMLTQRGSAPRTGHQSESSEDFDQIWSGLHPPDQKH